MKIDFAETLWNEILDIIKKRLYTGKIDKPIVFALYTPEDNHYKVIGYREILTVKIKGDYPNGGYSYIYPGIKKEGFYPAKSTGRWFSGTLVVGDDIKLMNQIRNGW